MFIFGLIMAYCACAASGLDMQNRHFTKAVEAFYELISNDGFEEADYIELMEYLAQRFHRKCYSLADTTSIDPGQVLRIVDNLQQEMNKLSAELVEITKDQTHFHEEMAEITEGQKHFRKDIKRLSTEMAEIAEDRSQSVEDDYVSTKALCSVQAYKKCLAGECCIQTSVPTSNPNLALGKPAWQSSNYNNKHGGASLAVDGNRDSTYSALSCTHTKSEPNPWWEVDLTSENLVGRVVIVNRGDGSWSRLRNLVVTVSSEREGDGEVCGRFAGPGSQGEIITIDCPQQILGRYVKVQMNSDNYLHICEVEVYSK